MRIEKHELKEGKTNGRRDAPRPRPQVWLWCRIWKKLSARLSIPLPTSFGIYSTIFHLNSTSLNHSPASSHLLRLSQSPVSLVLLV